ncbi:pyridoxal phosphate-dependent aminotransferase [Sphingomonas radiodurans]|uniref:pyridoxal phosphate-dependent aminotransferase n=1 Tax=Sphingomonas radiodurans TaxID=2890321 RepID=UPI001E3E77F0|nr:pyridoxal phosphate-dependent aminotransferase [Sphingomonas radiodurans]WBH15037.1 pyridoxal phosphate-dependent aminotransferase [Sphingomonas radiodurans]
MLDRELTEQLLDRGYSRRGLGRIAALIGGGTAISSILGSAASAQSQAARGVAGAVQIGANECWSGPFPIAAQAASEIIAKGNRYDPADERGKLIRTVAAVERMPEDRVATWPGSGDPLVRSVITFCSPKKGLVTADPTFESVWRAASWLEAPVSKVPLAPGAGTSTRAMLAANPDAGLYYICSPNNPTGTVTPLAEIDWLVANKPADSVVLIDEAYLHFSESPSAAHLAATRNDVIVMRTFSKLFGMAGMRLGLTFAAPDLHKRMMRYDGFQVTGTLPMTAVACGNASYTQADLITARRNEMIAVRETTIAQLKARGLTVHPNSQANMFMVDWKTRQAKDVQAALLAQKVQIGRSWPIWPTVSRVTVGSASEMNTFVTAVATVV